MVADLRSTEGDEAIAPRPPADSHRRIRRLAALICVAVACARFLSVDVAGIVTNDSLSYLARSKHPLADGFVTGGYRQVAYPLLMWTSNSVGGVLGWDHIFGMALTQRIVLAVAIGLAAWAMRWWSVPIVLMMTSSTYVMQFNFLLPEGLLVPLTVICGSLLASIVFGRITRKGTAAWLFVAMCSSTFLATSIKLQYVTMLALCAAGAWLLNRAGLLSIRFIAAGLAIVIGLSGVLAFAQSVENRHEYGVFEPVSERSLAEWYGAWTAIFLANPERSADPKLAEWYDGGNLYTAFFKAVTANPDYSVRRAVLEKRIHSMFRAAGTSEVPEHIYSFLGGLRGGRTDDIGFIVDLALADGPGSSRQWIQFNAIEPQIQVRKISDELNAGKPPGFVSFGTLFDRSQSVGSDYRDARTVISVIAIAMMLLGFAVRGPHRAASLGILTMSVLASALQATAYMDNARYLLGALTVTAVGGTLSARALISHLVESRGVPGRRVRWFNLGRTEVGPDE
jgi:hypothetical protein